MLLSHPGRTVRQVNADQLLGSTGEALAAQWYVTRGYRVLDRNWRCRQGELDLVVARGHEVVICEVKTRRSTAFGTPAEAVGPAKRIRLRRLAAEWLAQSGIRAESFRIDVASVIGREVEVIEAVC